MFSLYNMCLNIAGKCATAIIRRYSRMSIEVRTFVSFLKNKNSKKCALTNSTYFGQQQIENLIADRSIFNGGKSIYVEKSFRQLSLLKVTNFSQAEKKKMKEQTMRDPSLIEINQCSVLYGGTDYMKAVTYDQQEDDVVLVETFTEDQIIQQAYEKAKKNNLVIDLS